MKTLALGCGMPAIGLGTWQAAPGVVGETVKTALRLGYRHIDCAAIYGNEAEIGEALQSAIRGDVPEIDVSREQLWITSKLWNDSHLPEDVRPACERTLEALRLDYLDLYLVHWPVPLKPGATLPLSAEDFIYPGEITLAETWQALEAVVDAGLTRHLGVSNFSVKRLEELLITARIAPSVNQVELHPYLQQPEMLDFCERTGIWLTAYSPLGSKSRPETMRAENEPALLEDPIILSIASVRDMTPAQVALAWAVSRGTSAIPKSTNPGRLAENLAALKVELAEPDLARLAKLDKMRRYIDGSFWVVPGGPHSLESLWGA